MSLLAVVACASLFLLAKAQSGGCLQRVDVGNVCACAGKPSDGRYFLTSFDDHATCSCGHCHRLGPYFLANRSRWPCGTRIKICRDTKCVVAGVTDFGPGCSVETRAGGPVIDASKPVCQHLFGTTSCGWSDHYRITAEVVSGSTPFGPATGSGVVSSLPSGNSNGPATRSQCTGAVGVCQDENVYGCARGYLTGKCPGTPDNIRCCPSSSSSSSSSSMMVNNNNNNNNNGASTTSDCGDDWWSRFFGCSPPKVPQTAGVPITFCGTSGIQGKCQWTSERCARPFLRGKCDGPTEFKCCPSASSWAFLMDVPGLADEIDDDNGAPGADDGSLSGGYIALIVIGAVIFVLAIGICVVFIVRKHKQSGAAVVVANTVYGVTANGTLGQFKCAHCGKDYSYAEDLAEHTQLRHADANTPTQ